MICAGAALVHGAVALGRRDLVAQKKLTARQKRALVRQFSDAKPPCGAARSGARWAIVAGYTTATIDGAAPAPIRSNLIGYSKRQGERIVTIARLAGTRTVGGEVCGAPWSEWATSADLAGKRQEILHG